ncbi:hypothetical protein [Rhodovarius lipocyclicus]|nr:hypothetical protein [Rhodovarius lipocyclicus]
MTEPTIVSMASATAIVVLKIQPGTTALELARLMRAAEGEALARKAVAP